MKHPCPGLIASLDGTAPIASLDFETYYDSKCSVKELGAWAYCRHSDWEAYLITVRRAEFIGGAWLKHPTIICHPTEFNYYSLTGHRIYSHNAGFDQMVLRREIELGNAPADFEAVIEGWDCTADFSSFFCNRRSLKDAVAFMFGRTLDKSARDEAKGKRWSAYTPEEKAKMLTYGGIDADECLEIAIEAQTKWPDKERLLSRLTRLQGMRGVRLDMPRLELYLRACRDYLTEILRDIPWVGVINPRTKKPWAITSDVAYCAYCRSVGIPTPPVKATAGEDAYLEWEAEYSEKNPVIKAVSTYRSVNKVVGQLELLKERSDENGIFRFSLLYFGAHTGRFSGKSGGEDDKKESGFNMQNILKSDPNETTAVWIVTENDASGALLHVGPINHKADPEFAAFFDSVINNPDKKKRKVPQIFDLGGRHFTVLDMRALLIPRLGKRFAIADSSQIEPRCLAHLTGDRAFIDQVKQGIDIYEAHARTYFGFTGPIGHLKHLANDLNLPEFKTMRARAKAERLGLGYQAGAKGYQKAAAMLAGLVLSLEEAARAVVTYRSASPLVVRYWERLQGALQGALGRTLRLRLPSGRIMAYRNIQREQKMFVDPETGKPQVKWQLTAETGSKRKGFYGGKLTENMCQATARDVFGDFELAVWERAYQKALAAGKKGWEAILLSLDEAPLWQVHDEMIVEFLADSAKEGLDSVIEAMTQTPEWMGDTPFAAEGHLADQYLK